MDNKSFTVFYITHDSKTRAQKFVDSCLTEKWVACGNIFHIDSSYIWKTEVVCEDEFVSIVKTGNHLITDFIDFAKSIHPYETPCFVYWRVNANESYVNWIYDSVRKE
jgi:periplasmic divalent cation tolerance protein